MKGRHARVRRALAFALQFAIVITCVFVDGEAVLRSADMETRAPRHAASPFR